MFSRVRCHFCNAKQPYTKSVREFQCQQCEAHNFFDEKGVIADAPIRVTRSTAPELVGREKSFFQTYKWKPDSASLSHQTEEPFCRTCTQNQHIYNETLANYLPDESHPKYRHFAKNLPKFKKDLEERYPLVCVGCAAKAQHKINRADYYALTENVATRCAEGRRRGRQISHGVRETWGKFIMRRILNVVGLVSLASLFTQVAFHAYGILTIVFAVPTILDSPDIAGDLSVHSDFVFEPSSADCLRQSLSWRVDSSCYQLFGALIPKTLAIALCLLWYNPELKHWFHPTFRMQSIEGQNNHLLVQGINLATRTLAWHNLRDLTKINDANKHQFIAMHAFVVLFTLITQYVATRNINAKRWSIKGRMMPKPEEQNVLGVGAGPVNENFTPKASTEDPFRLLRGDNDTPVRSEMRQRSRPHPSEPHYPQLKLSMGGPTPEDSNNDEDDEMDVDEEGFSSASSIVQQRPRIEPSNVYFRNPNKPLLAVNDLAQELANVRRTIDVEETRKRAQTGSKYSYNPANNLHPEQPHPNFSLPPKRPFTEPTPRPDYLANPFQGPLPPAPMSMERRLRNPPVQPPPKAEPSPMTQPGWFAGLAKDIRPVQPTARQQRKTAEVPRGSWVLQNDVQSLPGGLEERFGEVFTLDDPQQQRESVKKGWLGKMLG